jgi:hypothetical protein
MILMLVERFSDPEGWEREWKIMMGNLPKEDRPPPPTSRKFPCPHEGDIARQCPSRSCGREWRHLRKCNLLDKSGEKILCVRGLNRPNADDVEVVSCQNCDYHPNAALERERRRLRELPPPPPPKPRPIVEDQTGWVRHVCYHVYPVDTGVWRRCIDDLVRYLHVFNGRRLAAVVTEEEGATRRLDPPQEVEKILVGHGFETIRVVNQPWGEVESWVPLMSKLRQMVDNPRSAVLWTHAKGVTKPKDCLPVTWWRQVALETALNDWPRVLELLERFPIVGSFFSPSSLRLGRGRLRHYGWPWHYSGTTFWMRLQDLFGASCWRHPRQHYGGIEMMPGRLFPLEQAGKLFCPRNGGPDLYSEQAWRDEVWPALEKWRKEPISRQLGAHLDLTPNSADRGMSIGTLSPK